MPELVEQKYCMSFSGSSDSRRSLFLTVGSLVGLCFLGAFACLWQWNDSVGWKRIDRFSGSALILSGLFVLQHIRLCQQLPSSLKLLKELFGINYDPMMGVFNSLLMLGELLVFLDYGQWHLVPSLEAEALQFAGIGIYCFALAVMIWADRYLIRHFTMEKSSRRIINSGPYRFIRHPRYAALFLTRIAFALTLASIFAWAFLLAWFWVVWRRIQKEEAYLHQRFGEEYDSYMCGTHRLIPGIF
jgi:protein-S-isoprenylcysteine O-methyltransferase Ste14